MLCESSGVTHLGSVVHEQNKGGESFSEHVLAQACEFIVGTVVVIVGIWVVTARHNNVNDVVDLVNSILCVQASCEEEHGSHSDCKHFVHASPFDGPYLLVSYAKRRANG